MLMARDTFLSASGKPLVLIVDDEQINRELLKGMLDEDFQVLTADDGQAALEIIQKTGDILSLILLDLLMPGIHGFDVMKTLKDDPDLRRIPVIVLTSDRKAEAESLRRGAADFICKPYPDREVMLARVTRSIELSQDRYISQFAQGGSLTGLYRYARQLDQSQRVTYARIAQALAQDYFSIYYVDTLTDQFIEYSTHGAEHKLTQERMGEDFFEDCKRSIPESVLLEDRDRALAAFDKESLMKAVEGGRTFSISYRLLMNGEPIFASLKALRLPDDPQHIIVGISNIDAQMRREQEFEKTKKDNVTFSGIAQALAADYFSIYYVNTQTDQFIEFSAHNDYNSLGIEKSGGDFFNLSRKNILRVVHPEDHEKILEAFTKEKLLAEMEKAGTFTLNYRLMFDGKPNYVSMKATRMMNGDGNHIVIGVNNINAQMQRQMEFDAAKARSNTFARIAKALSKDYYSIYLVNIETDAFIEYSSSQDYQDLHVEQNGTDFFRDCRRNVLRLVYKEDMGKALAVWDKASLMQEIEDGKTFSTTYRLMFDNVPVYINCKVIRMDDDLDNKYIVIGVSNVDAQMKREKEMSLIREKANRDALTGVKSKHAYVDDIEGINEEISRGDIQPFSVVVCDVNGLKTINDTQGHQAGDKLIMDASHIICQIFKHSPVYRVGGDEFVAILRGQDYDQREALMAEMAERNQKSKKDGGVIIACGASQWRMGEDDRFEIVFDRADAQMYDNKTALKDGKAPR